MYILLTFINMVLWFDLLLFYFSNCMTYIGYLSFNNFELVMQCSNKIYKQNSEVKHTYKFIIPTYDMYLYY